MVEQTIAVGIAAARVRLKGHVQGVGVRPAIANLARWLNLCGEVCNDGDGVTVFVQGSEENLDQFRALLLETLPREAVVSHIDWDVAQLVDVSDFHIVQADLDSRVATPIPRDRKVCDSCLDEVHRDTSRRQRYPFTSCTQCGPRYSIIEQMPYERSQMTMSSFSLCAACEHEYTDSEDRRFHAQTNACPRCGPHINAIEQGTSQRKVGENATQSALNALRSGKIVALKGLGGYQLLVDATNEAAVQRLRQRKGRREKPLAVMVPLNCESNALSTLEQAAFSGRVNPILLTRHSGFALAPSVTCGLKSVGIFQPTTPLHALLLDDFKKPVVATSGNREGDPLAVTPTDAERDLIEIADVWLHHDREIAHPIDDSVVKIMASRQVTIRLARGLAPLPIDLSSDLSGLAVGGHQAVAVALSNGSQSVLGPHIGDLDNLSMRDRFEAHVGELMQLYGCSHEFIACDLHPDYFTSRWAEQRCASSESQLIRVQHHHAHIAAGMIENGWHHETVLGVAFDGTGYGTDGAIWGGEFLLCSLEGFERVGHLRPFVLPGGEVAVRQPWRVALSLITQVMSFDKTVELLRHLIPRSVDIQGLRPLVTQSRLSPTTTSAGRLFDGIASLILGITGSSYEGQPAMLLEDACDGFDGEGYPMPLTGSRPLQIDWRVALEEIVGDIRPGVSPGRMAQRFHRGLSDAIATVCEQFRGVRIVLGGGVFQNQHLVEMLAARIPADRLGLPGVIPPNDGGLAAGQLAVAQSRLKLKRHAS